MVFKVKVGEKMIKVSIIVPVYNVETYIRKCLESLINQTLQEIEIIVVNDGSKDHSEDIVKDCMQKAPEKIKYYTKENGGLSSARNFGISKATGKYIGFVDGDDYVEKEMYEVMYNKAKETQADLVECNFYWEYPKKKKADLGKHYKGVREMLLDARVMACNKLYRREDIINSEVTFPLGLQYEDVEFFYKFIIHTEKVSFVKEPLYHYVQRKESIANSQTEKTKDIFTVLQHVLDYYKENHLYDTYKEELEYMITRFLLCSSFKRMVKIPDKGVRKQVLNETWIFLNATCPLWRENKYLNTKLTGKKHYLKSVNRFTYRIYSHMFHIFL